MVTIMKDLSEEFDKKFVWVDYRSLNNKEQLVRVEPEEIRSFIRQREKALLKEVMEKVIGEDDYDPKVGHIIDPLIKAQTNNELRKEQRARKKELMK